MVKNWAYRLKKDDIGELHITKGQYMTGNIMGVLVEKEKVVSWEGNLVDAQTFPFPVRYKTVSRITTDNYKAVAADIRNGIQELEKEGCRFIVTTGGRMGYFDELIHKCTNLMAISTPLEILEYASMCISGSKKICIVNDLSLKDNLEIIHALGTSKVILERCVFTDCDFAMYMDGAGVKLDMTETAIGAYIWDSRECCNPVILEKQCPIYSIAVLAGLLRNAVMQIPYEGGI